MALFDLTDYKQFLREWVEERPGGGRGEYRKIASNLGVSTTLMSQVVNGDKHFSLEIANDLCGYLSLGEREADYFLLLVEYGRAGSHGYRQRLLRRIEAAREKALNLSERLKQDRNLTESEAAVFYSNWTYTGVTHLIACDPSITVEELAERLKMPRVLITRVMDFLLDSGILVKQGANFAVGPKYTHIRADSPLVVKHHQNWRLQGFNKMAFVSEKDLFYTAPMSLSEETAAQIRRELPSFIEKILKWVEPSPSEIVRCLNIDWFEY